MSTSNAFPTPSEDVVLANYAWNCANEETSQEVPIKILPVIIKVVNVILFYCSTYFVYFVFKFQHAVVKSGAKSNPML
jgi:hypothetical protein